MCSYKIASNTQKFYSKEKNGDAFGIKIFEEKKLLVAIVCDGISQQPCDWKASDTVVETLINSFSIVNGELRIDEIKQAINKANDVLLKETGPCARLCTTLSLLVWPYNTNKAFYSNLGDSRIYLLSHSEFQQLSIDQVQKSSKKIMTPLGPRVVDNSQLTNFLGKDKPLINVFEREVKQGDMFLLTSDGFYTARATFEKDMFELYHSEDFEEKFNTIFKDYDLLAKDDMTGVVIKIF